MQAPCDGAGPSTQWPLVQICPVPQLALEAQPEWQTLFSQTPPGPHSLLNWQAVDAVTPQAVVHRPLTQLKSPVQSLLLVQAG